MGSHLSTSHSTTMPGSGGLGGGLFAEAPAHLYDTSVASPGTAGTPSSSHHDSSLFGGGSFFAGTTTAGGGGSTTAVQDMTRHSSSGYGSFGGGYDSTATTGLPGRFAEMDLSTGGAVSGGVNDGYGAPLDSFIGHDLVNQVFGGGAAMHAVVGPPDGNNNSIGAADHGAHGLLSIDLLGAIDGQQEPMSAVYNGSVHNGLVSMQPEMLSSQGMLSSRPAPLSLIGSSKGNGRGLGLDPSARPFSMDGGLSLPEDSAALFSPPGQPLVGLPGSTQTQFRSMW